MLLNRLQVRIFGLQQRREIVGRRLSQPSQCTHPRTMAMAPLQLPVQSVRVSRWSVDFGAIIGSGTFGSVYMARDEEGSGESVAAKVIYVPYAVGQDPVRG